MNSSAPSLAPAVDLAADQAAVVAATVSKAPDPAREADQVWMYRSEGFAEDLDSHPGSHVADRSSDSALVRWGLPLVALVAVVGIAALFTWV